MKTINPEDRCKGKYAENCTSMRGLALSDDVIQYSKNRWHKVICYVCQAEGKKRGILK